MSREVLCSLPSCLWVSHLEHLAGLYGTASSATWGSAYVSVPYRLECHRAFPEIFFCPRSCCEWWVSLPCLATSPCYLIYIAAALRKSHLSPSLTAKVQITNAISNYLFPFHDVPNLPLKADASFCLRAGPISVQEVCHG